VRKGWGPDVATPCSRCACPRRYRRHCGSVGLWLELADLRRCPGGRTTGIYFPNLKHGAAIVTETKGFFVDAVFSGIEHGIRRRGGVVAGQTQERE